MRASSFFSLATLAATAFAAPLIGDLPVVGDVAGALPVNDVTGDATQNLPVNDVVSKTNDVTDVVPVGDVTRDVPVVGGLTNNLDLSSVTGTAGGVTNNVPVVGGVTNDLPLDTTGGAADHIVDNVPVVDNVKRGDVDAYGLIDLLEDLLHSVTDHTAHINETIADVQADKITKDVADKLIFALLSDILCDLTELVGKVTVIVKVTVDAIELKKIVSLIICIVNELICTVLSIVKCLGLIPHIVAILKSIFAIIATLLHIITGIVAGIAPLIFSNVSPILNGVGQAPLLVKIIAPVTGVVSTLPIPL